MNISYILDHYVKKKFDNNDFSEKDFLGCKKNINLKTLGLYFKCLYMSKFNICPNEAKIMFKKKFKNKI